MAMAKFTVDTTNRLFIAQAGVTDFDVQVDLYSDAKEHWLLGGTVMGFQFPVRTIGGDPIGGGQFAGDLYFLIDGWQIRPDEVDHQLLVSGNLFHDDAIDVYVPTLGGFTVSIIAERSNLVLVATTTSVGGGIS